MIPNCNIIFTQNWVFSYGMLSVSLDWWSWFLGLLERKFTDSLE